ncbi:MAG: hypothetical protein KJZ65_13820 [Phycisphaerales bacterium]|nr:hypothetical protein [Phycisphaerales bacterium]
MSGLLITLAKQVPATVEGDLTRVIIGVMIGAGLVMLAVFAARAPREWSR